MYANGDVKMARMIIYNGITTEWRRNVRENIRRWIDHGNFNLSECGVDLLQAPVIEVPMRRGNYSFKRPSCLIHMAMEPVILGKEVSYKNGCNQYK